MTFLLFFFSHRDFSDVFPLLASAFEVDRLLKRTFLRSIPVWQLHGIVSTRMFHVSDVCVALVTFFPRGIMNKEEVRRNDNLKINKRHTRKVLKVTTFAMFRMSSVFLSLPLWRFPTFRGRYFQVAYEGHMWAGRYSKIKLFSEYRR